MRRLRAIWFLILSDQWVLLTTYAQSIHADGVFMATSADVLKEQAEEILENGCGECDACKESDV